MKYRPLPAYYYLHQCFRYEPDTGRLFWKLRPREHFKTDQECKRFNAQQAGREAFTYENRLGYRQGGIDCITYFAHRVIWKMVAGHEPTEIDHIDHCPSNNRWGNLRIATRRENSANSLKRKGVQQIHNGRWRAYLTIDRKLVHLGYFASEAEAVAARKLEMQRRFAEFAP